MEIGIILFNQIAVMFVLLGVGWALFKTKLLGIHTAKELGNILVSVLVPAIIINSLWVEFTIEKFELFGYSFIISGFVLMLTMMIGKIFYSNDAIANFSTAFSNVGFIAIPLVQATLGEEGVFLMTSNVLQLNILQKTYGVYLLTKDKESISINSLIKNPTVLGSLIGILLFVTNAPKPEIIATSISAVTALNTPIAMFLCGVYLAQTNIKSLFTSINLYKLAFVKLVIVPLAIMSVMMLLPSNLDILALTLLICISAPTGSNVGIYAQQYNKDYRYAVRIVCITTLLSIFTIPLILMLYQIITI